MADNLLTQKKIAVFTLLGLVGIVGLNSILSFTPTPPPDHSSPIASPQKEKTFTIHVEELPLGELLQQISQLSGYTIAIQTDYDHLLMTVSLSDVSIKKALKKILGRELSRQIVIDAKQKYITLQISDGHNNIGTNVNSPSPPWNAPAKAPLDQEIVPLETIDDNPLTFRELQKKKNYDTVIYNDIEVVPSAEGVPSITREELEDIIKENKESYDPYDVELVPSDIQGERGATLYDLEALLPSPDENSSELVPPSTLNE